MDLVFYSFPPALKVCWVDGVRYLPIHGSIWSFLEQSMKGGFRVYQHTRLVLRLVSGSLCLGSGKVSLSIFIFFKTKLYKNGFKVLKPKSIFQVFGSSHRVFSVFVYKFLLKFWTGKILERVGCLLCLQLTWVQYSLPDMVLQAQQEWSLDIESGVIPENH